MSDSQSLISRTKLLYLGTAISISTIALSFVYEHISQDNLNFEFGSELNRKKEFSKNIFKLETLKEKTLDLSSDYSWKQSDADKFFSYSLNRTAEKISDELKSSRTELSNFVHGTKFSAYEIEKEQISKTSDEIFNHGIYGLILTTVLGFLTRKKNKKNNYSTLNL